MDRNIIMSATRFGPSVALRKESVDRNDVGQNKVTGSVVALRKESVDRNALRQYCETVFVGSLSARRAWIEMSRQAVPHLPMAVALRKESVDRNPTDVVSV